MNKITLIANDAWAMYNFRLPIITYLKKHNYRLSFILPEEKYYNELGKYGTLYPIRINKVGKNIFQDFKLLISYYRYIKSINPDLIICYAIKPILYTSLINCLLRKKHISITTGLGFSFNKKGMFRRFMIALSKISLRFSDKVYFLNNQDKDLFQKLRIINPSKSRLLPSEGVDIDRFSPKQRLLENRKGLVFLLFGRLLWEKGITFYAEASRIVKQKHPNVEFQLLGFINEENPKYVSPRLINEWTDEGIINYLGSSDTVENEIDNADCIIFPSYYGEGVPRNLLESASMGKPIITTKNVGCTDVVIDGYNGYLCEPKDVVSLVNAIEKMINLNVKKRQEFGLNGRQRVIDHFSIEKIIDNYKIMLKESGLLEELA